MTDYLQIVHEADIALYQSKKLGRNRVTSYAQINEVTCEGYCKVCTVNMAMIGVSH
ncbi:hypothetical protein MBAV_001229 [Candidatus Magnetobacterium bavaricum]|uniref:GGDEF domain-containing protein n=1 Tax=Candidatus Magnetobacterium bavaricum TaxID=29290 RepID=A0A0F3GXF1_9BACT|nr:hypothetical protein MBAV_001229 [Candidatus Magnetobacterium bavaricum]